MHQMFFGNHNGRTKTQRDFTRIVCQRGFANSVWRVSLKIPAKPRLLKINEHDIFLMVKFLVDLNQHKKLETMNRFANMLW